MDWRVQMRRSSFFAICCMWGVLIIAPALWLLIGAMVEWGVSSQSIAAWVQAIGSVGAILCAVFIANAQHGREQVEIKRQSYQRDVGLATRLRFVAFQLVVAVHDLVQQLNKGVDLPENVSIGYESVLARLNQNFDDDLSVERIEIAMKVRYDLGIIVRVLCDKGSTPEYLMRTIRDMKVQLESHLKQAENHLESVSGQVNEERT
ncbi:MAG: hypothetical protein WA173_01630 [Pseudomonas sp.]|uniref:hypothetical protein n=1 Tax=Pseudomonas sp. TaxID=306 RepID=UPI003BB58BAC